MFLCTIIFTVVYIVCGQWQDPCWRCSCCADGEGTKCSAYFCNHGCVDGRWGNYCNSKCTSERCVKCHQENGNYCLECKSGSYGPYCYDCGTNCAECISSGCKSCDDGYWGDKCISKCSEHCLTCNKLTGTCTSCKSGFFGNQCNSLCGKRCFECSRWNGSCTSCENGYWGPSCTSCGSQCETCDHSNGCLKCNPGFYGQTCNTYNCYGCTECQKGYFKYQNNCLECKFKQNGCTCKRFTECSGCVDGYFLNPELCSKCPPQCITCKRSSLNNSITCTSCSIGRFGQTCQYECSRDCKNGRCREENAICQCFQNYEGEKCDRCVHGQHGETCGKRCSLGCVFGNCMKETGSCSCMYGWSGQSCDSCSYGHYGNNCEYMCEANCDTCNGKIDCQSCIIGKYGNGCQSTCPVGCLLDICVISDGSCHICKDGYYGTHCENICPNTCQTCDTNGQCLTCKSGFSKPQNQCNCRIDICDNEQYCSSCNNSSFFVDYDVCCMCNIDGCLSCTKYDDTVICSICNAGFYSSKVGQCSKCNSNCIEHACNSSSGKCLRGCIDGFWSNLCERVCYPGCKSCRQVDGLCTKCTNNTKHGSHCNLDCSTTCKNSVCDIQGNCLNGCISNTFGKQCEEDCDEHCISKDDNTICSEQTGMCLYGCDPGYRGELCQEVIKTKTEEKSTSSPAAALGVGIGGGIVALSTFVVLGLFLRRRRKVNLSNKSETSEREPENFSALYATVNKGEASRAEYPNRDTDNLHSVNIIENSDYQSPPAERSAKHRTPLFTEDNLEIDEDDASARDIAITFEENGGVYYNNANEVSKFKKHVSDLPEYVQNLSSKHSEEELQKIPYGLVKAYEVSQTKLNMHKNRYRGIYPYDDTRVLVRGGETDYINASYIDGFRKRNAYIATLGPMAKQLGDFGQFWRMVWQQEVEKIVMVTNLVEGKKTKCEQYWPDQYERKLYGDIEVVCKVEKLYADFIWRQFTLSKNSEERKLHHLQFTSWPDKDIPDDVTSVIEFRQRVNALPSTFNGPVVVHCSAGVGRTGTYIALDILTKEGETEGALDIPGCILNMRQNRPNMIQTLSQYKYLHQALVHTLTLDCSLIRRQHFSEYMEKSSKQEIQKQFEKMQLSHENKSDKELQAIAMNRLLTKKNREHADIPGDSNRPHLKQILKTGETDYINAIYINSLKTKQRFLVAQTPLPDTVADFTALAVQENCSCIVSMEGHLEKHKGIGLYFPGDNQTMKKGKVSVRTTTDQSTKHVMKRKLQFVLEGKTKKDVTIPHYEYLEWDTKHNVPKSPELFVAFIKEVEDASKASHLKGPILLHCLNGAGKSGLFCVVSTLLEQLCDDNEVCVVNSVQKVRARRPRAIPNKEQFFFCYECVLHSVNAADNAVYYNISGDIQRE